MASKYDYLIGKRFGKLLVEGYEVGKGCKCVCDCGNTYYTKPYFLIHGRCSSCGCMRYEHNKYIIHPKKGHKVFHYEIIGKKFGHLEVLDSAGYIGGHEFFKCICDCGTEKIVDYYKLITGHTSSCGSSLHKIKRDYTNKRFGRLTALKPVKVKGSNGAIWECKCDCGNIVYVTAKSLDRGTKSCGCLMKEIRENKNSKTRLYSIWSLMRQRCSNPNLPKSKCYYGRGIRVCEEWNSFDSFKSWAENNGYSDNLTIERIDVNGNYCPENCKWIPFAEQANNKQRTLRHMFQGKLMTLIEIAKITKLCYSCLRRNYHKKILDDYLRKKGF